MSETKKRNHYLGAVEGLATYLVVMIHCRFPGKFGEAFAAVVWFAVPMFFAVSGYFYFNADIRKSIESTKRKVTHLVPMIVGAELFYYLWDVFLFIRKYGVSFVAFRETIMAYVRQYRFISCFVPFPLVEPACWFVLQLMVTYIIVSALLKRYKIHKIARFAPPCLVIIGAIVPWCVQKYWGFDIAFNVQIFVFFAGLPYFLVGYSFHCNQDTLRQIKKTKAIIPIMLVLGIILSVLQFSTWRAIGPKIGHYLIVLGILLFIIKKEDDIPQNVVIKYMDVIGNKYSLYIYLFHQWVFGTMDTILYKLVPTLEANIVWTWIRPFAACAASTVFAVFLYQLMQHVGRKRKNV